MTEWLQAFWLGLGDGANALADRLNAFTRLLAALGAMWQTVGAPTDARLRRAQQASSPVAYETVSLDLSLVIKDARGERATLTRRQRLRFHAGAPSVIRELVLGEGQQVVGYRAQGARRVAVRPEGSKRTVLLEPAGTASTRRSYVVTSRRAIRSGFAQTEEYCEALLERPTDHLGFTVRFPASRPPQAARLVLAAREEVLRTVPICYGPDGRARLRCNVHSPLIGMTYSLRWS